MFLGYMVGVLVVGVISDKFGRKPLVYFLSVLCNILALGASFVHVYWLYVFIRVLVGVCVGEYLSSLSIDIYFFGTCYFSSFTSLTHLSAHSYQTHREYFAKLPISTNLRQNRRSVDRR